MTEHHGFLGNKNIVLSNNDKVNVSLSQLQRFSIFVWQPSCFSHRKSTMQLVKKYANVLHFFLNENSEV